jgi:hypothetical protein
MRVLFVRRAFLVNNTEFRGSAVVQSLTLNGHEVDIASAIWADTDMDNLSPELKQEIIPALQLDDYEAVYVEGGYGTLLSSNQPAIFDYTHRGGILIFADNDANGISGHSELIDKYQRLFGGQPDGEPWNPIKVDESFSLDEVYNTRFSVQGMELQGLEKELVNGLDEIAVGSPITLDAHTATYLLTGTNLSSYLKGDLFVEPKTTRAWAILNHFGLGYAILIGGRFTDRITFNAVPGNAIWLERVLSQLKQLVDLEKPTKRQSTQIHTPRPWDLEESKHHEKKATAFKPLSTGDEKTIIHMMAKTIAALCNTGGGTLVIGQADDGTILGIEDDVAYKAKGSFDKYQLAMRDTLASKFGKTLEVLGVQLDFPTVEEKTLAVFTCSKSNEPIYTKGDKDNNEHLYIRDGNRTTELLGSQLVEYVAKIKI